MFASVVSFAQQHSVNGTVKDQNGQPVIGLTVLEQGTKNGVIIRSSPGVLIIGIFHCN